MSDYGNSIVPSSSERKPSELAVTSSPTSKDNSKTKSFESIKDEFERSFEKLNSSSVSLDEKFDILQQAISTLYMRLGTVAEESAYVKALQEELSNIKNSLYTLELQKNTHTQSINAFQDFVQNNLRFIIVAMKAEANFEINEKRLSQLESKAEKKTERSLIIGGIIASFIASMLTCIVSIALAFLVR